jgi:hypothetical protein
MAIKYINTVQSEALQNLPKSGFLDWKMNNLATLLWAPVAVSEL